MRSRTSATSEIDRMYNALQCIIRPVEKTSGKYSELRDHFLRKKTVPIAHLPISILVAYLLGVVSSFRLLPLWLPCMRR